MSIGQGYMARPVNRRRSNILTDISIFRDTISVPTISALARARRHLDSSGRSDATLVIKGGLRKSADFAMALALGGRRIDSVNSGRPDRPRYPCSLSAPDRRAAY